jgi:uncharacterized protein
MHELARIASPPTIHDVPALLALVLVGAIASGINAVAGGGSLLSFPALVGFGVPALEANATNALALWPGAVAGAIGFANQLSRMKRALASMLLPSAVGGALGAWLLVSTPERAFKLIVPVLVLGATVLLALQPRIRRWSFERRRRMPVAVAILIQLAVSVYGGYFGAGMGILMLAVLGLMTDGTLHELNAVKAWLGLLINLVASVLFLARGVVVLAPGLALMVGAIGGGYLAARVSQKIDPEKLRKAIVALGFGMAGWFSYQVLVGH